jgi:hypothetical protein
MTEYVDLEMNIRREHIQFRVDEADYEGPTNFTAETLNELERLCSFESQWEDYGVELFRATFRDRALRGYQQLRGAVESGRRFRLRLNIHPRVPRIHRLWWECLYDPEPPPQRLGCGLSTPLSRYLRLGVTRQPATAETLRILVAISNPEDLGQEGGRWARYPRLDEDQERGVLKEILDELRAEGHVEYDWQDTPASLAMIRQRLYRDGFHVLHFVGHGGFLNEKGHLLLEKDEDETVDPVGEKHLAEMVAGLPDLQLVVLAACFSAKRTEADAFGGLAPRMVEYGVPAVVAMQQQVDQNTAQLFTRAFYDALLKSKQTQGLVDAAVNAARDELFFSQRRTDAWAWTIPVLFMRGDGRLFETKQVEPRSRGPMDPRDEKMLRLLERILQGTEMPQRADPHATSPGKFETWASRTARLPSSERQVANLGEEVSSAVGQPAFWRVQLAKELRGIPALASAMRVEDAGLVEGSLSADSAEIRM